MAQREPINIKVNGINDSSYTSIYEDSNGDKTLVRIHSHSLKNHVDNQTDSHS